MCDFRIIVAAVRPLPAILFYLFPLSIGLHAAIVERECESGKQTEKKTEKGKQQQTNKNIKTTRTIKVPLCQVGVGVSRAIENRQSIFSKGKRLGMAFDFSRIFPAYPGIFRGI